MSEKEIKEHLEKLSNIQDNIIKLVNEYNRLAIHSGEGVRLGLALREEYFDEYSRDEVDEETFQAMTPEEKAKFFNSQVYQSDYNNVRIITDKTSYSWFPSSIC